MSSGTFLPLIKSTQNDMSCLAIGLSTPINIKELDADLASNEIPVII